MSAASYPRIPYGMGDFARIREDGLLHVDKTRFPRPLEDHRHAFLIRPRRFGKTCWVALLQCYYDRALAECFDALFAGTDIGADPTPNRSRYVILRFDFSAFSPKLSTLEERFEEYCALCLESTLRRNRDLFPDATLRHICAPSNINGKLNRLFEHVGEADIPLYVLIYASSVWRSSSMAGSSSPARRWRPVPARRRPPSESAHPPGSHALRQRISSSGTRSRFFLIARGTMDRHSDRHPPSTSCHHRITVHRRAPTCASGI